MKNTKRTMPLRAALASLHARALLGGPAGEPTPKDLGKVLDGAAGEALSPAKQALLLRATLAHFDAAGAARRMAPTQAVTTGGRGLGAAARPVEAAAGLTVEHLDVLTPALWRECVTWLLESEGYHIEPPRAHESAATWHGERDGQRLVASALRQPGASFVGEDAVQRVAALATGEPGAQALLLTTATAMVGAVVAARRLGVRLLDRPALSAHLATLETAYQREQAQVQSQAQARAEAAAASRSTLLAALSTLDAGLAAAEHSKRATGRAALSQAVQRARVAQREIERALLAWETLLGEWSAAFGERAARDGTLSILADADQLREMAARGTHLGEAMAAPLRTLAETPAQGEAIYTTWRRAVLEELDAHLESARARVTMFAPAQWERFEDAFDAELAQRGQRATSAAGHAAARSAKAYTQLAQRLALT